MEWKYAFLVLAGLCGIFVMAAFLARPVVWMLRLVSCALVGTVLILVSNMVLGQVGMRIAINPATVLTAGILQIPGALLLVVLNCLFV
ncbi:MAG: pro-sigmaK processing inhibitor BofA family protein [Peptococcaceae bacterium]|nr:pro-sigmaK processing inhibitor BofA family protein [Peptococcaceae bacterium]